MRPNAVVVAPYAPGSASAHLGAAKKIELILSILDGLGFAIHLVDSSHTELGLARSVLGRPAVVGRTPVSLWRPACLPNRKLGKLWNVVAAGPFAQRLCQLEPAFVWVYNSYSFEARVALLLRQRTGTRIVLELEDLPLARSRWLNPKPRLDQFYFPRLLAVADLVTFVNASALRRFASPRRRAMLLPSLLQAALVSGPDVPRFGATRMRLGYFGGLEAEKGADVLVNLIGQMPPGWTLVVTGAGSLAPALSRLEASHPDQVEFHGRVSHESVLELMKGCDAIVNPHTPIALMDDGVFPFKVCEALASGALLISTPLPEIDADFDRAVVFFDGTPNGLAKAMRSAPKFWLDHSSAVVRLRDTIRSRYSEATVSRELGRQIEQMLQVAS